MAARLSSEQTLPLVDIVEMVMKPPEQEKLEFPSAESFDISLQDNADEETALNLKTEETTGLPAFYSLDSDDDDDDDKNADRSERRADVSQEGRARSVDSSILEVESVGVRSVDEILAAHQEAERQLAADRQQEISARQRLKIESRSRLDDTAATPDLGIIDEWEKAYPGSNSNPAADVQTQRGLQNMLPRSKRRLVRHSGGGFFDYDAMELSTDDDSSDGEEAGDTDLESKATSAAATPHRHDAQKSGAAAHKAALGFVDRPL